jgi:hypothetical protein
VSYDAAKQLLRMGGASLQSADLAKGFLIEWAEGATAAA